MLKFVAILALVVVATASASAPSLQLKDSVGLGAGASVLGVVTPARRCGGVGTPIQLRISDCEGKCILIPGQVYNCEKDFMPSSATTSITLKVEVCQHSAFCMQILEATLPNSSIQPGFIYTAKYSIVPNDILAGQTVEIRGYLSHTDNGLLEICVAADVDIANT